MFRFRMQRSYTCLVLVAMVTMLQVFRPVSARILSQPKLRMTENVSYEKNFKNVESVDNLQYWEAITQVRHDQMMARWSRSMVSDESWPCPNLEAISPCTCNSDTDYEIEIDCSNAESDEDIASAFSVVFPFDDVQTFIIANEETTTPITAFTPNIFQSKWFSAVNVVRTNLERIDDNVFELSHDTLETLALQNNKITDFPFDVILEYSQLRYIHLNGNDIKELPKLSSTSLHQVNMNNNPSLILLDDAETFIDTPELRTVSLSRTSVNPVPPNLFSTLQYISDISLSGNGIQFLEPGAINAPDTTITTLDLSDNSLIYVQIGAISGLAPDAELDLSGNIIDELTEELWRPIFDQLETGSIILDGNPLVCGCEMNWIIIDDDQRAKISDDSTCIQGIFVSELDIDFFLNNCQQPQKQ